MLSALSTCGADARKASISSCSLTRIGCIAPKSVIGTRLASISLHSSALVRTSVSGGVMWARGMGGWQMILASILVMALIF